MEAEEKRKENFRGKMLMRWTMFVKPKKEITDTRLLHIGEFLLNWPKTYCYSRWIFMWTNYSSDACSFEQFSIRYTYTRSISQVIRKRERKRAHFLSGGSNRTNISISVSCCLQSINRLCWSNESNALFFFFFIQKKIDTLWSFEQY
jgi:hypothetical protein